MIAGARCRSSMVSNSGTIGRVQLSTPGGVGEEPAGLGQEVGAEHVAHALRHAEHEGAEGLPVDLLPQPADQREHARRSRPISAGSVGGGRARRQRPGQLGGDPGAPRLRARARAASPALPPARHRSAQRGVELGGVLADVEPDGAEAERLDLAAHRPDDRGRRSRSGRPAISSSSISRRSASSASAEA